MKLLENAVPEVEVIQQPGPTVPTPKPELYIDQTAETGKDASGKFVVPSQLAKGARRRKSSRSKSGRSKSRSSSSRRNESDESSQQSRGWQPYREPSRNEPEQTVANDHRSEPEPEQVVLRTSRIVPLAIEITARHMVTFLAIVLATIF